MGPNLITRILVKEAQEDETHREGGDVKVEAEAGVM